MRAAVAKSYKSRPSSAKESRTTRVGSNSVDTKHWRKDEWSKDVYKHVALHDKGLQPAFIFREVYKEGLDYPVGKGQTYESKEETITTNTYHHAWSKSVLRRNRPASAKPPPKQYCKVKMIRPRSATYGAMRIQDLPQSLKDDQIVNENGCTS